MRGPAAQTISTPPHIRRQLTKAEREAICWLRERSGDGMFDRHGVVLACGELAPHVRSTWNALSDLGFIEFYNPAGNGRGRLRLTARADEVPT
jgi:hypothetical protein